MSNVPPYYSENLIDVSGIDPGEGIIWVGNGSNMVESPNVHVGDSAPTVPGTPYDGQQWFDTDDDGNLTSSVTTVNIDVTDSPFTIPTEASHNIFVDCSGGDVRIILFTAVGNTNKRVNAKKVETSSNSMILETVSSQTIDLAATVSVSGGTIGQLPDITCISNNTNWFIE